MQRDQVRLHNIGPTADDESCQRSFGELVNHNPHYDTRYFEWQSSGGRSLAEFETWKFARFVRDSDTVLDFGCGAGYMLDMLNCGERYGVEINQAARASAMPSVRVYGDIDEIPSEIMFDLIISNHALEHVDHPLHQLERLKARLRPGGKVVFVVPSEAWLTQRSFKFGDINQHLYTWTPLSLGNLLTRAGFFVERVELLRHRFLPKPSIACRLLPVRLFYICCSIWGALTCTRQIRIVAAAK